MDVKPINACIDKKTLSDVEAIVAQAEQEAAAFDASCYDGDACHSSSG